uniref:C-type lectin domain-containing protein n=1 Tax=Acrobeloides nanus TaxID=290746 RepID=A0A914CDE6_9BILA
MMKSVFLNLFYGNPVEKDIEKLYQDVKPSSKKCCHKWFVYGTAIVTFAGLIFGVYCCFFYSNTYAVLGTKTDDLDKKIDIVNEKLDILFENPGTISSPLNVDEVELDDNNDWHCFKKTYSCYKVMLGSVTQQDAYYKCLGISGGKSYLATFESKEENDFVGNLLPIVTQNGAYHVDFNEFDNGYWIGYESSYDGWLKIDYGAEFVISQFTNWAPGEPSNYEDCVMMYTNAPDAYPKLVPTGYGKKWNNMECDKKGVGYVCKKPMNLIMAMGLVTSPVE